MPIGVVGIFERPSLGEDWEFSCLPCSGIFHVCLCLCVKAVWIEFRPLGRRWKRGYDGSFGRLSPHGGNWGETAMCHKVQHLLFYDSCYSRWKKLIPKMRLEIQEQLSVDKSAHSYIVSAQLWNAITTIPVGAKIFRAPFPFKGLSLSRPIQFRTARASNSPRLGQFSSFVPLKLLMTEMSWYRDILQLSLYRRNVCANI